MSHVSIAQTRWSSVSRDAPAGDPARRPTGFRPLLSRLWTALTSGSADGHEPPVSRLDPQIVGAERRTRPRDVRERVFGIRSGYLRAASATLVAGVALAMVPASAQAVSYGIADAPSACSSWSGSTGTTCNNWTYGFAKYYPNGFNYFTNLKQQLPLTYARFFVPYDAVQSWNGSACANSPAWNQGTPQQGGAGQIAFYTLADEIQDAKAIGLQPTVVLSGGTGIGGVPPRPDPTTLSGYQNYYCGLQGIMNLTTFFGLPVNQWEPWNEPDAPDGGYQGGTRCSGTSGADQAALLWSAAEAVDTALGRSDLIAAGAFTHPSIGYFNDYYCELTQKLGQWPTRWSFHAYNDVGSWVRGTNDSGSLRFDQNLYNDYANAGRSQPYVWITEAAIDLTSKDQKFSDGSSTVGCDNGDNDNNGQLGACLDASPLQQQNAAPNFLNLASLGSAFSGQIRQVYWYEFQASNPSRFDSGLLSPPASGYPSPNGQYGQLRQSFCVLTRQPVSGCSSSTVDASDWSTYPGPGTNRPPVN